MGRLMRQGLVQAIHHARYRKAFQRLLVDQPLRRNVLADLALESEAHLVLTTRVARAIDASARDKREAAFARLATAVGRRCVSKRAPSRRARPSPRSSTARSPAEPRFDSERSLPTDPIRSATHLGTRAEIPIEVPRRSHHRLGRLGNFVCGGATATTVCVGISHSGR